MLNVAYMTKIILNGFNFFLFVIVILGIVFILHTFFSLFFSFLLKVHFKKRIQNIQYKQQKNLKCGYLPDITYIPKHLNHYHCKIFVDRQENMNEDSIKIPLVIQRDEYNFNNRVREGFN